MWFVCPFRCVSLVVNGNRKVLQWYVISLKHRKLKVKAWSSVTRISADLPSPILSEIGRRRAFTLKICTAVHSWEHFCLASVDRRPSAIHRPTIGRQSGDILGVGRPSTDDRTTGYREIYMNIYMYMRITQLCRHIMLRSYRYLIPF